MHLGTLRRTGPEKCVIVRPTIKHEEVKGMIISARVSEESGEQIKAQAYYKGISVSEFLRRAMEEQLEGEERLTEEQLLYVREQTRYNLRGSVPHKKGAC